MGRRRPLLLALPAALAAAAALAPISHARTRPPAQPPFAPAPPPSAGAHRTFSIARPTLCGPIAGSPYPWDTEYPWPVEPFHEQHPIRGYFGDPRTVFREPSDPDLGSFSFHNGVDIVASVGTPVYPVVSGVVSRVTVEEVVVSAEEGRHIFQYWHIAPVVALGQSVEASKTVLGNVTAPARHVHLTEIVDGRAVNPLQPGHLTPYDDSTAPTVEGLYLRNEFGKELRPDAVSGTVDFVARAYDVPAVPVPEPWTDLPVSPARVGFQLTTPDGREVLPDETVADFARTEPSNGKFFDVYAAGTFQNDPAVGKRYYHGTAGDYLYELTPGGIDTDALRPGPYLVTVTAEDTCGNRGSLTETIDVLPQKHDALTARLVPWPKFTAWTIVVASVPKNEGLGAARDAARLAVASGATEVGIRHTRRSFLVFSGVYLSRWDADQALARKTGLYPRAYVRTFGPRA
jgi:murein DD-endopeptidase MepM/ murein hydrolase activator NlpD